VSCEDAERIDAEARSWREGVVMPLRAARRSLRAPDAPFGGDSAQHLRAEVKRIELQAERIQQETMERMHPVAQTGVASARADAVRANLASYAAYLGGLPEELLSPLLRAFNTLETAPH
jgi:hypothetical protein